MHTEEKQRKDFWMDRYDKVFSTFERRIDRMPGAFIAFNTNTDALKFIDKGFIDRLSLSSSARSESCDGVIRSMDDFRTGLMRSMETGKAMEWVIDDDRTYRHLLDSIDYDSYRIGGQAGIVANVLSSVGLKDVVVFNPRISETEASMYVPGVKAPSIEHGRLVLRPARDVYSRKDMPKINLVFEYDSGIPVKCGNKRFTTPRKNRFIVSYRPKGREPFFPDDMMGPDDLSRLFGSTRRIFISGYQSLTDDSDFFRAKVQLGVIRNSTKDAMLHYEFTSEEDLDNVRRIIRYIFPEMDSLGCNERETCILLDALDLKDISGRIRRSGYGSIELMEGIRAIKRRCGLKRIHVHNIGFMLCITDKGYAPPEKTRDAIILCVESAFAKSIKGFLHHASDLDLSHLSIINPKGISELGLFDSKMAHSRKSEGIYDLGKEHLVIVPTKNARHVTNTVGLGDTVSSVAFIGDML